MATASSSGLSSLGRKKKAPGLMDQIGNFFGGDKKRKSKDPEVMRTEECRAYLLLPYFHLALVHSVACPLLSDLPRQPLRVGRTLLCASSERSCPLPLLSLGSQQDPPRRRRPVQATAEPCPRSSKWAQAGLGPYPKNEVPFKSTKADVKERDTSVGKQRR